MTSYCNQLLHLNLDSETSNDNLCDLSHGMLTR